jgi:signal transduction histidine kinase
MSFKTAMLTLVFVLAAGMVITSLVLWIVYIVSDYHTIRELYTAQHGTPDVPAAGRWAVLTIGITFLSIVLVVLSVFFANLLRGARFKQQQKDFVNMMTHELKLPMSSIQMFAQTLKQRDPSREERERFLDCILADCARMNLLLDHLLKAQLIERGKLQVQKRRMDMGEFVQGFAERWPRPLKVGIRATAPAQVDPVLMDLALTNLVNNAEKYGKGGSPEVTLEVEGAKVRISVQDEGTPIPRKYAKKIFNRFFRMPTRGTRRQSGVGLGLYIVKSIARMHGGTVELAHPAPATGAAPVPKTGGAAGTASVAAAGTGSGAGDPPPGNRFTLTLPRSA